MGFRAAVVSCLVLGAALRTIQYSAQASLWLDELALAQNVVWKPLGRLLLEPLDYQQVAPAGFLALERLAFLLAGPTELGLRFVPWIASLIALFLFWRVLERTVGVESQGPARGVVVAAVALFAASPSLIVYAGQAKQYASDVAAVLALVWAGLELARPKPRTGIAVTAGTLALLVSAPAVLAGVSVGGVLAWNAARSGSPRWRTVLLTGAAWGPAAAATALLARYTLSPETAAYMQAFWARGFPPPPWAGVDALLWVPAALKNVLGFTLFWFFAFQHPALAGVVWMLALATAAGAWWMAKREGTAAAILLAPIAAAVIAAAARQLPMDTRVSLWLGPLLLLLAAAGFVACDRWLPARLRALPAVLIGAIALVPTAIVTIAARPPYRSQDVRPLLQAVAAQAAPGDAIYVYYGARLAMRFYGPPAGLTRWTEGACHRGETRAYYRELDQFRGRPRVWFIWTHALPRYREPDAIRSYLETIGRRVTSIDDDPEDLEGGAQAVLYDLSDAARLSRAAAETHDVPPEDPDERHVPCGGPGGGSG